MSLLPYCISIRVSSCRIASIARTIVTNRSSSLRHMSSSSSSPPAPPSSSSSPPLTKIRVYTKTGDKGTSSLFNQERRAKDDDLFQALGETDELNAGIGVCREYVNAQGLTNMTAQLEEIQSRLFDVGAHIATPRLSSNAAQLDRTEFSDDHVTELEKWIDEMEVSLPPLRNFILPSGGLAATHLHVARAVCRRAERRVIPLAAREDVDGVVLRYLNRLSDYLFVCARYASLHAGGTEVIWKKPRAREAHTIQQTNIKETNKQ